MTVYNVKDFGAQGDGVTEDQQAFKDVVAQIKVDGGGTLYAPAGTYALVKDDFTYLNMGTFNVHDVSNIELAGDGIDVTVLKLKPGIEYGVGADTHLINFLNSSDIIIHDMTLDGSRLDYAWHDEHMHGLMIWNTKRMLVERVKFYQMRGDGIKVIGEQDTRFCTTPPCYTEQLTVQNCQFYDNGRSGITNQGGIRQIAYLRNKFELTSDQDIDLEPTGNRPAIEDMVISGNTMIRDSGYALTIAGDSSIIPARRITVTNNNIMGGRVIIYKTEDVEFSGNTVINSETDTRPTLTISRYQRNVRVANNYLEGNSQSDGLVYIVYDDAFDVVVVDNDIVSKFADMVGINLWYTGGNMRVAGNRITCTGQNAIGIRAHAGRGDPIVRHNYLFHANELRGTSRPFRFSTFNTEVHFDGVIVTDNTAYDPAKNCKEAMPIEFDAGIGNKEDVVVNLMAHNNWVVPTA